MRKRIGEFLVDQGVLTPNDVQQVLEYSTGRGLRFGEAAMELGVLSKEDLIKVFGRYYQVDFFHVQPDFFPKVTKDLLPRELILEHGVLALGFKTESSFFKQKRVLNLGLLSPESSGAIEKIEAEAMKTVQGEQSVEGIKHYLILADHFLKILSSVYGLSDVDLKTWSQSHRVHPTLLMYL